MARPSTDRSRGVGGNERAVETLAGGPRAVEALPRGELGDDDLERVVGGLGGYRHDDGSRDLAATAEGLLRLHRS